LKVPESRRQFEFDGDGRGFIGQVELQQRAATRGQPGHAVEAAAPAIARRSFRNHVGSD
jgi:hypothetical protein